MEGAVGLTMMSREGRMQQQDDSQPRQELRNHSDNEAEGGEGPTTSPRRLAITIDATTP